LDSELLEIPLNRAANVPVSLCVIPAWPESGRDPFRQKSIFPQRRAAIRLCKRDDCRAMRRRAESM
jgi:hypothetical protein